jgi:hypothetical protein
VLSEYSNGHLGSGSGTIGRRKKKKKPSVISAVAIVPATRGDPIFDSVSIETGLSAKLSVQPGSTLAPRPVSPVLQHPTQTITSNTTPKAIKINTPVFGVEHPHVKNLIPTKSSTAKTWGSSGQSMAQNLRRCRGSRSEASPFNLVIHKARSLERPLPLWDLSEPARLRTMSEDQLLRRKKIVTVRQQAWTETTT